MTVYILCAATAAVAALGALVNRYRPRCYLCGRRVWREGRDCSSCARALAPVGEDRDE